MKTAVLSSHTPSLLWFRTDMMQAFRLCRSDVVAIGNESVNEWEEQFAKQNVRYLQAEIQRNGTNPFCDIKTFFSLRRILKRERPDRIFTYQAKTVIYGCLAAKSLGMREIYPLIAGVGSVFLSGGMKSWMIRLLLKTEYRLALRKCPKVFFQNADDTALFLKEKMVKQDQVVMLNGSGVNLKQFTVQDMPDQPAFLFVGRLIRDKGVYEYLEACKAVKKKRPEARCMLVGPYDSNPSALKKSELRAYVDAGIVEYFGEQRDVRPYLRECSVFVLPSYREGTPKAVLEAMATGRAVITTDTPGCRETVIDGENGYLVEAKNVSGLAEKMLLLADSPSVVQKMAAAGRKIAEEKFDVDLINEIIVQTMKVGKEA